MQMPIRGARPREPAPPFRGLLALQHGSPEVPHDGPVHLPPPELVARSQEIEEDGLVCSPLTQFEVVAVDRRLRPVLCRYVAPGTPGGEDIQDPVEEVPGIPARPADVGFPGRKVPLDDLPGFVVDLPECHASLPYHPGFL